MVFESKPRAGEASLPKQGAKANGPSGEGQSVGALPETVATPPGTTREQFTESATDMQSQLKVFAQPCKFLQALQDETLMSRSLSPHGVRLRNQPVFIAPEIGEKDGMSIA
jgi:hypothetical protein